jgi:hypothetical protein
MASSVPALVSQERSKVLTGRQVVATVRGPSDLGKPRRGASAVPTVR